MKSGLGTPNSFSERHRADSALPNHTLISSIYIVSFITLISGGVVFQLITTLARRER